ncbi:DUF4893 domain-containing protein [Tahibacter amnicola]|uniref:DUF4893 domain-containing protein n=1 Tax=Tahibacter amnicola TaxID=2976241 RepID=A0ABY6BC24_9GAMM|nr:DUF4893 domain-containing protein [Tahibacter amnicola]UXI67598.1 DUF4893 domain-containing protein [Tahibacter amnicola]
MRPFHQIVLSLLLPVVMAPALAQSPDAAYPVRDEHRERITHWRIVVDQVNADPGIPRSDGEGKAVVEELLAAKAEKPSRADLLGDWRVRSIQGTRYGIFTYPYFKARIAERDGRLFFEKTSGSQRRSGYLHAPEHGGPEWIFTGGASVNDDPQVSYSLDSGATSAQDSDSVGVLWKVDDQLIMVLDARGDDYEIYQLKRP